MNVLGLSAEGDNRSYSLLAGKREKEGFARFRLLRTSGLSRGLKLEVRKDPHSNV